jgi:hypothetical protein
VHLSCIALEEATAATNEEGIAGEDRTVRAVLEIEADTVLSMAWCVKRGDLDALTDCELRLVCWRLSYLSAVLSANDRKFVVFELLRSDSFSNLM